MELGLLQDPTFKGNSVKIEAVRLKPADSKYPCKNYDVQCFNFDEEGKLVGKDGYTPDAFKDLCPSTNIEYSEWKFEYKIHSQKDCYGEVLNAEYNPHNFVCFDVDDLDSKDKKPNVSIEKLLPGKNKNDVVCITENASKTFDFDVCVDKSSKDDYDYGLLRLDCGCKVVKNDLGYDDCYCGQDLSSLPDGCHVKPENYCQVVCQQKADG